MRGHAGAGKPWRERGAATRAAAAIDHNKYHAVLLTNGAEYFGRWDGLGSEFPVLTDV